MPYIAVNDIRLYYEEQGGGTPLVLLHGGTGTIEADSGWGRLRSMFAGRYRLVLVEHRGHGRTNNPTDRITYEAIADDVCAVIDRLGLAPCHIAGMSDGGIAALHIGMTRPEVARSLVLVGTNYRVDDRIRDALRSVTPDWIEREQPAWHTALVCQHDQYTSPGYWRTLVRQVIENASIHPSYTGEDLQRISTPTLLIAGEHDPFGNLDQMVAMKRHIPLAELLIVNNAGHIVQHTHPRIVGPAVIDFLARHTTEAASTDNRGPSVGMNLTYETMLNPPDDALQPLSRGLDAFNVEAIGPYDYARVAVFARNDTQEVIGGLYGDLLWDWLYIQTLWVHPAYRRRHVGTALLKKAEEAALACGITKAHLETTSFQAKGFYAKNGYDVFGTLEGKPAGATWYYLKKEAIGHRPDASSRP